MKCLLLCGFFFFLGYISYSFLVSSLIQTYHISISKQCWNRFISNPHNWSHIFVIAEDTPEGNICRKYRDVCCKLLSARMFFVFGPDSMGLHLDMWARSLGHVVPDAGVLAGSGRWATFSMPALIKILFLSYLLMTAFLSPVAFLFNWIGFFLSFCLTTSAAGRYGAISGFGLSLIKWVLIVRVRAI